MQPPRHDDLHEMFVHGSLQAAQSSLYSGQALQPLLRGKPSEPPLHLQQQFQFLFPAQHQASARRARLRSNSDWRLHRAPSRPTSSIGSRPSDRGSRRSRPKRLAGCLPRIDLDQDQGRTPPGNNSIVPRVARRIQLFVVLRTGVATGIEAAGRSAGRHDLPRTTQLLSAT